ncbi:hypothetical protein [Panacagrimonas sp.]|uniref:hypothetical protein n=1 Tax=Panacagrimonas sp. TaxID=2480088 RepID=UPI003B51F8A5
MSRADAVNRKLRELDTALAERRIERDRYRFLRRALITEFEEQPAPSSEITRPEAARPESTATTSTGTARPSPSPASLGGGLRPAKVLGIAVGGVVVMTAISAAWWALTPKAEIAPADGTGDPAPLMPQDLARGLMESPWSRSDLTRFQQAWARMPEVSIRAASEDPRMWLLRQEIEHRLRDAREALALQTDERNQERLRQLEEIQNLIRHRPGA